MSETMATDWEDRFQSGTTPWQRDGLHPAFLAWRESGLLGAGRILVPGAGRSPEPLSLAEAGVAVTVVDAAPSAIAFQARQLAAHGGIATEADLLAWEPSAPFDAVYDQTCLCALPPTTWPRYAARLHDWLRPGGVLAILFMQTGREGGPPFDCPPPAMRALFPSAEWDWPETLPAPVDHPSLFVEQPAVLTRR